MKKTFYLVSVLASILAFGVASPVAFAGAASDGLGKILIQVRR